ncbi:PadR family transcriptional regulator [Actinomadura sp. 7K507]|uniref:PadR family transcriptional regulator n=1 Tax=Actinomadura sp. 7K507 TaxID=2530365 RepID=UPI001050B9C0|nr:PadR family transcriptional regulator [Actinomadura sp. 7K507]TDC77225.1 PadR family transcriptional regulator [Actinomadura sp. 7K507]
MAKRRKISNLLALGLLSALMTRPMHPYEMASVLRARSKDEDLGIKWGSLYRVVQNLEKHGFVQVVQSERQGARPERTVYRITEAGQAELVDWVRELIGEPEREEGRFKAGLSLLGVLSPDDAVDLLVDRINVLEGRLAEADAKLTEHAERVPRLFLLETEYELAVRRAEVEWARSLLREITDGSMPGLAEWRAFHTTGEVPSELAELAERGTGPD